MGENQFTQADRQQLEAHGIPVETAQSQIEIFRNGIRPQELKRPCTIGDGIRVIPEDQQPALRQLAREAASRGRVMKFVPASGAATRMFKALHAVRSRLASGSETPSDMADAPGMNDLRKFATHLDRFAFHDALHGALRQNGFDLGTLQAAGDMKPVLDCLLTADGLNYGNLPKGLIPFHRYPDGARTAFEEHLAEAAAYTRELQGTCRVHFTIAPQLESEIKDHFGSARRRFESQDIRLAIDYSFQKPATDTLAVTLENSPFRDQQGQLLFRPAGHGALLENLEQLDGDIVYIKNIDNVVPDQLKETTVCYKEILGGLLVAYQTRIHTYLQKLEAGSATGTDTASMLTFACEELNITAPDDLPHQSSEQQAQFLRDWLNRPIRVCGMVRNVGEPGGGPFWVQGPDGIVTPQIVESASVDHTSTAQEAQWQAATHFNPVDVVCGLRNFLGQPFALKEYVDPEAGFISHKSLKGRDLKALELPGLWNGSMADWITLFVEVPSITFNPVKTVFDLLRPEHQ